MVLGSLALGAGAATNVWLAPIGGDDAGNPGVYLGAGLLVAGALLTAIGIAGEASTGHDEPAVRATEAPDAIAALPADSTGTAEQRAELNLQIVRQAKTRAQAGNCEAMLAATRRLAAEAPETYEALVRTDATVAQCLEEAR